MGRKNLILEIEMRKYWILLISILGLNVLYLSAT